MTGVGRFVQSGRGGPIASKTGAHGRTAVASQFGRLSRMKLGLLANQVVIGYFARRRHVTEMCSRRDTPKSWHEVGECAATRPARKAVLRGREREAWKNSVAIAALIANILPEKDIILYSLAPQTSRRAAARLHRGQSARFARGCQQTCGLMTATTPNLPISRRLHIQRFLPKARCTVPSSTCYLQGANCVLCHTIYKIRPENRTLLGVIILRKFSSFWCLPFRFVSSMQPHTVILSADYIFPIYLPHEN